MKTNFWSKARWPKRMGVSGLLLLASALVPVARADQGDPPTRVARISYVKGSVSMQPGGAGEWANAETNRPMTIGDRIWVDKDSRAELQAGNATIHLDGNTALSFLNLDERTTQMRVAEGLVNFRVRELREGELYEVDTPNLAFTVTHAGDFRVEVNEQGDVTSVTSFRGEGEVTAGGRTFAVHPEERAEFRGTESVQYETSPAPRPDNFDRWAMDRDLRGEHSHSAQYVSRDVVGYEDLDDYGYWRTEPEYGPVWYPNTVAPGWAPYSYGYWGWEDPWGWTWIDYAPWGFAPFHYGRWAFIGGGWGWCPGPVFVRPIYSPAFVSFFGFGGGFGFGFGGPIGWCPLGFGEPFFPWFRASNVFITNINIRNTVINNRTILNTTNIHNFHPMFAHNPRAVTAVSHQAFVGAQPVNKAAIHLTAGQLRNAQVTRASFSPTQQSRLGVRTGGRVSTPPSAVENRAVLTRNAPAAAARNLPARSVSGGGQAMNRAGNPMLNGHEGMPVGKDRAPTNGGAQSANRANNPMLNGHEGMPVGNDRAPTNGGAQGANRVNNPMLNGHEGMPVGRDRAPANSGHSPASSNRAPVSNERAPMLGTREAPSPAMSSRQRELQLDKPQSALRNGGGMPQRGPAGSTRSWEAQGNVTDRGRAPQGFNRPAPPSAPSGGTIREGRMSQGDRPPWAGGSNGGNAGVRAESPSRSSSGSPRGGMSAPQNDRPWRAPESVSRGNASGRSFEPPAQSRGESSPRNGGGPSYSRPSPRSNESPRYSSPSPRSYSAPRGGGGGGGYSAPSRSSGGGGYSAPSRSSGGGGGYSAPSHSSGGGGGGSHSSGGGISHSTGGGSSHGRH